MTDTITRVDAPVPPEESLPRKSSSPLLWLLLVLALLAAIWFFYNRSASNATVVSEPTPTPIIGGDAQQAAAQAERNQADATAARKTARAERKAPQRATVSTPRIADRNAEPVARIQPKYPAAAYRNREEGSVLVRADVDANGMPANVSVVRRSGSRDLDNAALAAVRQWHFRPAIENGKAVASAVEVPVDFRLDAQ